MKLQVLQGGITKTTQCAAFTLTHTSLAVEHHVKVSCRVR